MAEYGVNMKLALLELKQSVVKKVWGLTCSISRCASNVNSKVADVAHTLTDQIQEICPHPNIVGSMDQRLYESRFFTRVCCTCGKYEEAKDRNSFVVLVSDKKVPMIKKGKVTKLRKVGKKYWDNL